MKEAPGGTAPLPNCNGVKKFLLWFRNHAGQEKPLCSQKNRSVHQNSSAPASGMGEIWLIPRDRDFALGRECCALIQTLRARVYAQVYA
jgi:hypothetical protein